MKFFSLHIFFFLFSAILIAQEQQYFREGAKVQRNYMYEFDTYNNENGLSDNAVVEIFQDSYGFMWFGTENGLNKFDGYSFTRFLNSATDSSSISNNYIMDIDEDIYGNLWIATKNGLNKFNRAQGTFTRINHFSDNENSLKHDFVRSILADSIGNLWIDTWDGYLHKYNVKTSEFSIFQYDTRNNKITTHFDLISEDSLIWIFSGGNESIIFNKNSETFSNITDLVSDSISEEEMIRIKQGQVCMVKDQNNNYYFGNYLDRGVFLNKRTGNVNNLKLGSTYTMLKLKNEIWLGGFQFGLVIYDIEKNLFNVIRVDENSPKSLPSNFIWKIFEDKNGNIWIGTGNGLARYSPNKSKFNTIKHIPGNDNSIISNSIKDIEYSKRGDLWIATHSGISKLNLNTYKSKNFIYDENNPKSLSQNAAQTIYEDLDTTIWIGYWTGRGFDRYNERDNSFSLFSMDHREEVGSYDWYSDFVEDSLGNFYPLQWGGRFSPFNRTKEKFESMLGFYPFQRHTKNDKILFHNNQIWVADAITNEDFDDFTLLITNPLPQKDPASYLKPSHPYPIIHLPFEENERINGFYKVFNKVFITTENAIYTFNSKSKLISKSLDIRNVTTLFESNNKKEVWIGTKNGMFKAKSNSNDKLVIDKTKYFEQDEITSIFIDSENNMWIGTKNGLYFNNDKYELNNNSELTINIITSDKNDRILIGTNDGMYAITDSTYTKVDHISNDYIFDIFIDVDNTIWVGSKNGLTRINDNQDTIHYFHNNLAANSISSNVIYKIVGNNNGKLFLGTSIGINTFDVKKDTIIVHDEENKYSPQSYLFNCGLTDTNGDIWLGNYKNGKALNKFDPIDKTFKHYIDRDYDSLSYKGNISYFIFEDKHKNIWAGSDKGLNLFNSRTENFTLLNEKNGFPNNNIVSMEEDQNGDFWLGTLSGLVKFNKIKNEIEVFDYTDGISSNTFDVNSSEKLPDGRLVFGTDKGLTIFHPDSIKPYRKEPTFHFTKFFIYDSIHYHDLSEINKVELNYKQNNFTIEFSALDFIYPEKQHYQYMLEGYDKKWITADYTQRQAKYTDLPYGTYTFLLKASNHDGYYSSETKELKIEISPPWYLTIYAKLFYGIVIIILMLLTGNIRLIIMKRRNKELEKILETRTKEILDKTEEINQQEISEIIKEHQIQKMKERFSGQEEERKRISRELHDGIAGHLTGIKLFLDNLPESDLKNKKNMLAEDIDRLYNEVRNLSHDLLPPEFEETTIKEVLQFYIEQLVIRSQKNISIAFHPQKAWIQLSKSLQIEIYRIIQELSQNALKHSNCSNIDIEVVRHQDFIAIMIEDDGKGMDLKSNSKGVGLSSLKSRINQMNGKMNIDSQEGRGTIVNIELPYNHQQANSKI